MPNPTPKPETRNQKPETAIEPHTRKAMLLVDTFLTILAQCQNNLSVHADTRLNQLKAQMLCKPLVQIANAINEGQPV